jgi:hypothetical protein
MGAAKVSFSKGSVRGSGSCPSLNRIAQHAAIWADGTQDAGLLHSDIDAVAQCLLKIFFHLWGSIGFRERIGERCALLTHHDNVIVSPAADVPMRCFGLGRHSSPEKNAAKGPGTLM